MGYPDFFKNFLAFPKGQFYWLFPCFLGFSLNFEPDTGEEKLKVGKVRRGDKGNFDERHC